MSQNNGRRRTNADEEPEEDGWSLFSKIAVGVGLGIGAAALLGYAYSKWIETTEYLFHYTTEEGVQRIERSRRIKRSTGGTDCHFGPGVYMTSLHPKEGPEKILKNNYNLKKPQTTTHRRSDNANCFFRFNKTDLPRATKQNPFDGRDIWLCPHEIDLNTVDYVVGTINANVALSYDKNTGALTAVDFSK